MGIALVALAEELGAEMAVGTIPLPSFDTFRESEGHGFCSCVNLGHPQGTQRLSVVWLDRVNGMTECHAMTWKAETRSCSPCIWDTVLPYTSTVL